MSVVFPNSNLPTSSQPWGREVTKQLSNIIASSTSAQINNAARDNQLNSSIIALNAVVNEVSVVAQEASAAAIAAQSAADAAAAAASTANTAANTANTAINGLLGLGSTGSGYTINVSNITSGGARDGVLTITSGSNSSINLFNGGVDINGPAAQVRVGNAGNGGIRLEGQVTSNGLIQSGGNMRSGGTLGRIELDGGGTTGASINNAGNVIRTTSSERYKQDIQDLEINYEDLLLLSPKKFRLKEEVSGSDEIEANKNARYYAGFIAEEIAQTPLDIFVSYEKLEDGTTRPDGVHYAELTSALLAGIKHQDGLIKSLTNRIETIEKGA
jgi:hypothetical protein